MIPTILTIALAACLYGAAIAWAANVARFYGWRFG